MFKKIKEIKDFIFHKQTTVKVCKTCGTILHYTFNYERSYDYFCDNPHCSRHGLITVVWHSRERKEGEENHRRDIDFWS